MKTQKLMLYSVLCTLFSVLLLTLCGCETFRKKFVRKSEQEKEVKVVVRTQEYQSQYSKNDLYRKYYLFWRTAHQDLIELLASQDANRKRLLSESQKSIEYLQQLRQLLTPQKQALLDDLIAEQKELLAALDQYDLGSGQKLRLQNQLKRQKKQVEHEFNYRHIQEYLAK